MAIISPGPLVSAVSGSIGGVVFRTGASTPTVRLKPRHRRQGKFWPTHLGTSFAWASRAWAALSSAHQTAWRRMALSVQITDRLGRQRPISGKGLFLRYNLDARMNVSGFTTWPPYLVVTPPPLAVTAIFNTGTYNYALGVTTLASPPSQVAALYGARHWTDHKVKHVRQWTLLSVLSVALFPYNVYSPWSLKLGALQSGESYSLLLRLANPSTLYSPAARFDGITL